MDKITIPRSSAAAVVLETIAEIRDEIKEGVSWRKRDDLESDAGRAAFRLLALFGDLAMDRDDRLKLTSAVVGREIGSANELSRDEASKVIDMLNGITEGTVSISFTDEGAMTLAVQSTLEAS